MSSWFDKIRRIADSPDVAAYKTFRAAGKSWFPKIMAHPASKEFDLVKAAKKVGIPVVDNTIVFDDECETAVLMDYFLFDYRPKDKSVADGMRGKPLFSAEIFSKSLATRIPVFIVSPKRDRKSTGPSSGFEVSSQGVRTASAIIPLAGAPTSVCLLPRPFLFQRAAVHHGRTHTFALICRHSQDRRPLPRELQPLLRLRPPQRGEERALPRDSRRLRRGARALHHRPSPA
jgi:hypothetical protein